jgi:lipoic acid synthetase
MPRKPHLEALGRVLADLGVNTVCQSARCPNLGECFSKGTATFLMMGRVCTRRCRFCAVEKGVAAPLDPSEPRRVAEAARALQLRHVVVTSVTRDDLPDGGSGHFADLVAQIRALMPAARVEVLVPDFGPEGVQKVMEAPPDVFGHNVETIPRLYPSVRPAADYLQSLALLRRAKEVSPVTICKSGLMVGLGETEAEVVETLGDLREAGVEVVTIGQYLQPTRAHLPVADYLPPAFFERMGVIARELGFAQVISGPLVRSSYHAEEAWEGTRR